MISVTISDAEKYEVAIADFFMGEIKKSFLTSVILSLTIKRLLQNAMLTQHTASRDEINSPPTIPFTSVSGTLTPSGSDDINESL